MKKLSLMTITFSCLFTMISCGGGDSTRSRTGGTTYNNKHVDYRCDNNCRNCEVWYLDGTPATGASSVAEEACEERYPISFVKFDFVEINNKSFTGSDSTEDDKSTSIFVPVDSSDAFSLYINFLTENKITDNGSTQNNLYDSIKIEINNIGSAKISFAPDYLKKEKIYKGAKIDETIRIYSLVPDSDVNSIQKANIRFLGFSRGYGYIELDPYKKFTVETQTISK